LRQVRLLNLPMRDGASNVGEEPHSQFNYEWDNLQSPLRSERWPFLANLVLSTGIYHGVPMMQGSAVAKYLDLFNEQRESIFRELTAVHDDVLWHRPEPGTWSIGEHLDHTRVVNCYFRRLFKVYVPLASVFARLFRNLPYETEIDDVWKRRGFAMKNIGMHLGWLWPPKYGSNRPVGLAFLQESLELEHAASRRFYSAHDESLLGHIVLPDPTIGALNVVQWLRVQAYHDAHHFGRVHARLEHHIGS